MAKYVQVGDEWPSCMETYISKYCQNNTKAYYKCNSTEMAKYVQMGDEWPSRMKTYISKYWQIIAKYRQIIEMHITKEIV